MSIWDKIDISNFNEGDEENNEKLKELLSKSHGQLVGNYFRKIANTGRKLSDDSKQKISQKRKGMVFSKEHSDNLKKQKLIHKIKIEDILEAQNKFVTAKEVASYLGITFNTYKRIATELGVYKKLSLAERNNLNGCKIHAWKYDSTKEDGKGEYVGVWNSRESAAKELKIAAISKSAIDGTFKQLKGYVFRNTK